MGQITVTSLFGARHRQPFVELAMQDPRVHLTPEQANQLGQQLQEAAAASIADAALYRLASDMGLDDAHAGMLIRMAREVRVARDKIVAGAATREGMDAPGGEGGQ